jgi:hypothetical protein
MATTATDLVDQARRVLAELQQTDAPISRQQWESFDQTVYRLLHELDGALSGRLPSDKDVADLHQLLRDYPQPLQPVDDQPDFSIKEAARLLGTSENVVRSRIWAGALLAAPTSNGYRIPRSEVIVRRDLRPASTDDTHPIARLSCTLGALNDLLVLHRLDPSAAELQAQTALSLATQTLSITAAAARRALALCDPVTADRPLSIARYAAEATSLLPGAAPLRGLQNPAIPAPDHARDVPAAQVERSLHEWASAARDDLRDNVPSVAVLQDINRQGVHIYAALDFALSTALGDMDYAGSRKQLRAFALALQAAAESWTHTSTGMPPSRPYVEASRRLYTALSAITGAAGAEPDELSAAYQALLRGASDVAWLTSLVTSSAFRLQHSGVLFIHARHAKGDPSHLSASLGGRMVEARAHDLPHLHENLCAAQRAAAQTTRVLPREIAPSQYRLLEARSIAR